MQLTDRQITLVQTSFERAVTDIDTFAALFYHHLFTLHPEAQALFKGDMQTQGRKLVHMLLSVLNLMNEPVRVEEEIRQMALRHVEYGVASEHYDLVGEALIWSLQQQLGDQFTDEMEATWRAVYDWMVTVARNAAYKD